MPVAAGSAGALRAEEWQRIDPESRARLNRGEPELYDVEADPDEARNVAAQHPDTVAALRTSLDAWWNPATKPPSGQAAE